MGMISKQKMTSTQLVLFSSMGLKLHWLGIAWKPTQCSLYDQPPESKKSQNAIPIISLQKWTL